MGLSNQGATCYMNSLLQTLYMTPDFRNEIYRWQYDSEKHGETEDCIPMQLQLLFSRLQLEDSVYVETTGLTKSFQWDLRDSFQQHDVQEFCRVLFDAIEQSMEGTDQANVINQLYQGTYIDYVKCLGCNFESCREDKFLDISLSVRNDYEKIYNKSVEMALENYIKHEELTGDNQYFCGACKGKRDAIKGLKFKSLPKILVLQLKRFDLDITTMQRVKLNEKVTFPEILNMNPFISQSFSGAQKNKNAYKVSNARHIQDYENHMIHQSQDKKPLILENFLRKRLSGDNSYFLKCERKKLTERYLLEGKNVYELFSIMIHSGSALGGHYYAYIKNFENSKWYCFNDSTVSEITPEDITKVYGGNSFVSGNMSSCSTNAYLLMYRRIEPDNLNGVDKSLVPGYILEHVEKDKNKLAQDIQDREEKLKNLKIKIVFKSLDKFIEINKDATIRELTDKAIKDFNLAEDKIENVRLRGYSSYYETFQEVYEEEKTVDESGIYSHKVLSIEIKADSEEFMPYDPTKLSLKVHLWQDGDLSFQQLVSKPKVVIIEKRESFRKLMEMLQEIFGVPMDKQIIVRKTFNGAPEVVSINSYMNQSLSYARIFEGTVIFLERSGAGKGKWISHLEDEQGKLLLRFNDPREIEDFQNTDYYKHSLSIDSHKIIQDMKEEIGKTLGYTENQFIMKKSSMYGPELKDLEMKLSQAGLFNNNQIYIELGQPSKTDEIRINFQIALNPRPRDSDGSIFAVDNLFDFPVNISLKILQVKEMLCNELKLRFPTMEVEAKSMRFRYNSYTIMGKILNNKEVIKELKLADKVNVCVQLLDEPERLLDSADLLVYCKIWLPNTWEISNAKEIIINKNSKIHDLGAKIAALTNIEV